MNVERLVDEIMWIPHLDLGMEFDKNLLLRDFGNIVQGNPQMVQPYRTTTSQIATKIASAWQGVSLFSPDGTLHNDLTENSSDQGLICKQTQAGDAAPYMLDIINQLGGQDKELGIGTRARVMIVQPKSSLSWHSHQMDNVEKFRPHIVIVHIPIVTPPDFRYSVIPLADMRLLDHENKFMKIYTQNYEVGRATMFNCVHMHNVFNDSDSIPRISLMLYLDLRNPKTFAIVDKAVANYSGDYIAR